MRHRSFIRGMVSATLMLGLAAGAEPVGHETGATAPPAASTVTITPITADVSVDDSRLLHAGQNADDWLLHGRTYDNQRFSPLRQISDANVKSLRPVAIIQTGVANSFEATPIVVDGTLYISTAGDQVLAYDAVSGELLWSYKPGITYSDLCCGPQSRGVAVAYGKVFIARLDATIAALDARTGHVIWKSGKADTLPADSRHFSYTSAPQVYDGLVIIGSAGAEYPHRGFVQAYDAETGSVVWRFRTIAAPGEPGGDTWSGDSWKTGGGSVWNTPAIDPGHGLVSFGVGNPNPDLWGETRKGDNAYTDSIVAVHAKDGKLAWWYQQVAHDLWDFDACGPVVFLDVRDGSGRLVPAAAEAGKEGHLFIVDRLTGALIRKSEPFVLESANKWTPPALAPGQPHYPSINGGALWSPPAFSPQTRRLYIMGTNHAWIYTADPDLPANSLRLGGKLKAVNDGKVAGTIEPTGNLSAIDVDTGRIAWQYQADLPMIGGVLATAGNLVFAGELNGHFNAFDARNGARLWQFNLGVGVNAPPVTYRVKGVQYVAVAAGGVSTSGLVNLISAKGRPVFGDVIAIFALPEDKR